MSKIESVEQLRQLYPELVAQIEAEILERRRKVSKMMSRRMLEKIEKSRKEKEEIRKNAQKVGEM